MFDKDELIISCLVILGFVVIVSGIITFFTFVKYTTTQEGEHSGYVTALEKKGLFWQNWYVYFKTDNSSSQEDVYCLPLHSNLVETLKTANRERKQVTILYDGMRGFGFDICDGEYITGAR